MSQNDIASAGWFKSSHSRGELECVEVAFLSGGRVGLRDSKDDGAGPAHVFTAREWDAFLHGVKAGEFDRP
jgi:hypothetical protein